MNQLFEIPCGVAAFPIYPFCSLLCFLFHLRSQTPLIMEKLPVLSDSGDLSYQNRLWLLPLCLSVISTLTFYVFFYFFPSLPFYN